MGRVVRRGRPGRSCRIFSRASNVSRYDVAEYRRHVASRRSRSRHDMVRREKLRGSRGRGRPPGFRGRPTSVGSFGLERSRGAKRDADRGQRGAQGASGAHCGCVRRVDGDAASAASACLARRDRGGDAAEARWSTGRGTDGARSSAGGGLTARRARRSKRRGGEIQRRASRATVGRVGSRRWTRASPRSRRTEARASR